MGKRAKRKRRPRPAPAPSPNRPTPEGRALGAELARLVEGRMPEHRARFPLAPGPCKSCAFRAGTVPNGCPPTLLDAIKCVVERRPFYCHESPFAAGKPTRLCRGWAILVDPARPPIRMPYEFSE